MRLPVSLLLRMLSELKKSVRCDNRDLQKIVKDALDEVINLYNQKSYIHCMCECRSIVEALSSDKLYSTRTNQTLEIVIDTLASKRIINDEIKDKCHNIRKKGNLIHFGERLKNLNVDYEPLCSETIMDLITVIENWNS